MKKSQHSRSFWSGKGFYVALTLVIAGAATASFLAINSMMSKLGTEPVPDMFGEETTPWQHEDTAPAEEKQQGVPVSPSSGAQSTDPASSKPSGTDKDAASKETEAPVDGTSSATRSGSSSSRSASSSAPSQQPSVSEPAAVQPPEGGSSAQPAQPAQQFASPKSGTVLQAFSGDELVYNETMKDWRTHNGTDIEAKAGDTIKAPMAGTVTLAEDDLQWGGTVEIEADGFTARVCGLDKVSVKQGQTVALGDTLGKLGETPAESALPVHVHIEMTKDGVLVDPASYFSAG